MIHVLGDALSRFPNAPPHVITNEEFIEADLHNLEIHIQDIGLKGKIQKNIVTDQYFQGMNTSLERGEGDAADKYKFKDGMMFSKSGEMYILRKSVREILNLAHRHLTSGHFDETLNRGNVFHWSRKTDDFSSYVLV